MTDAINAASPYDPTKFGTTERISDGALGKDDFMSLLIAQMQHQDPMSPTDPTQFISQLSEFSSLEQLIGVREGLDLLAVTQTAGTSAEMVSFIGKDITFADDQLVVDKGGDAAGSIAYSLERPAETATLRVFDGQGNTLREVSIGSVGAGRQTIAFDGLDADGKPLAEGSYRIEVSAEDAQGRTFAASMTRSAAVSGVTFEAGYPELMLSNGEKITLSRVLSVANADDDAGLPILDKLNDLIDRPKTPTEETP